jgi:hypothetical protein
MEPTRAWQALPEKSLTPPAVGFPRQSAARYLILKGEAELKAGILITLLFAALTTACAAPFEGRITRNLNEAGIPQGMAECMAAIWVDRLSVFQLREISRLSSDLRAEGRGLTVGRLVQRVRQVDDPVIFEVVSTSAGRCAFGL